MKRYKLTKRANKRDFRRNALRVNNLNVPGHNLMRGGIRL